MPIGLWAAIASGLLAWLLPALLWAAEGPFYISTTDVNLRESPNGEIVPSWRAHRCPWS